MIVMTPDAGEREIAAVRSRLETTGVHVLVMPGELTTAIGAIGDPEASARSAWRACRARTVWCRSPQALYGSDFAAFASRVAAHAGLDGRRIA